MGKRKGNREKDGRKGIKKLKDNKTEYRKLIKKIVYMQNENVVD